MQGDPGKPAPATPFVLCPPACADAVRRALPPGCDVVVAGSPEEARAAFAERTRAPSEPGAGEVAVDGRTIDLTTLERAVFDILSRAPGRSFSRAALLREIHGEAAGSVLPRVVDSTVSRLRRKLGPSGWRVETVWGRGYRWNAGDRPAARPFLQALRWSAGTLGVILVATLLVPRPRPEEPSTPVAEPAPPVIEASVAAEPSAGDIGDIGDFGDLGDGGDAIPDSLADLSVAEPAQKPAPAPAPAPARSAKRAASAPAVGRAAAACAPAPVPAVVLPPDDTLAPKDGFEIHAMTAEDKTLSNLARSRGITLAELLAANPQIADPDLVRAGQLLYLPARPEPSP